jgi:hypothetical protein
VQGAIFQMLSHGIVSGALFLCVGVIYDRLHTREIAAYGGLVNNMPKYAVAFMVFTMANVGLPGTSGFVGEFLTVIGVFRVNTWVALFAATGVILSACLRALALSPGDLRRAGKGKPEGPAGSHDPREADPLSAGGADHLLRCLSGSDLRCDGRFGGSAVNNYAAALQAAQDLALSVQLRQDIIGHDSELFLASLQLSMPEIILAVGALALLMIGVFSGDRSAPTVTGLPLHCSLPQVSGWFWRRARVRPMAAPSCSIRSRAS